MNNDVMTLREVAEYLKVTERTLYRLVQEGRLPAFRVGSAWRVRRSDLEQWIAQQTQDAGASGEGDKMKLDLTRTAHTGDRGRNS